MGRTFHISTVLNQVRIIWNHGGVYPTKCHLCTQVTELNMQVAELNGAHCGIEYANCAIESTHCLFNSTTCRFRTHATSIFIHKTCFIFMVYRVNHLLSVWLIKSFTVHPILSH